MDGGDGGRRGRTIHRDVPVRVPAGRGKIAGDAAMAAFSAAGLMLIFVLLGLWHGRKVSECTEI